mmetsp:Transcript_8851/g.16101  ORF Transcript_8851/g.16101 Transcript_8851/m.16101 type:complete len:301 (-) Transcript_8851:1777-2679(-)
MVLTGWTTITAYLAFSLSALSVTLAFPLLSGRVRRSVVRNTGVLGYSRGNGDDDSSAERLPLSDSDMKRLSDLRSRHEVIPIMILDSMLPGQRLQFGSEDPKFEKMVEFVLQEDVEIGMIGMNPYTGKPLNMGVTLPVQSQSVNRDPRSDMLTISAQGQRRFEVQGEPWKDDTGSFYLADVEIVEHRIEELTEDQRKAAEHLSSIVPEKVEEWCECVITAGKSDLEGIKMRMMSIGPMPEDVGERAIWLASLLNPLPPLGVCLEIRPAMLACRNDFDRIQLATSAVQSSIDHLSGKRKLF